MQKSPDAYRGFIETYADRVLFGSDATSDWPELIQEYIDTVKALICDEEILSKIFQDNYLKVHCWSGRFSLFPFASEPEQAAAAENEAENQTAGRGDQPVERADVFFKNPAVMEFKKGMPEGNAALWS